MQQTTSHPMKLLAHGDATENSVIAECGRPSTGDSVAELLLHADAQLQLLTAAHKSAMWMLLKKAQHKLGQCRNENTPI